ncbi:MAG: PIG-L family deacetylase [Planctomycetaceae bacterium]
MKCIFLSPHLDDAVLSCGGLIAELSSKSTVEIWTPFCGAPWCGPYSNVAKWLHGVSGGKTGNRLANQRRKEDQTACKILGARFRHLKWYDAVYRKSGWKRFLYPITCQSEINYADEILVSSMTQQLQRVLAVDDVMFVPLSLGGHVDHRIVRAAAERTGHSQVIYYPEIPYLQRYPEQIATCTQDLRSLACKLDVADVKIWTKAVACYQSQLSMLEAGTTPVSALLEEYLTSAVTLYVPPSGLSTSASESLLSYLNWRDQDEEC